MAKNKKKNRKRKATSRFCPARSNKEVIVTLLKMTKRDGIEGLISHLENDGYFEAPAGMKNHSCCEGGLAEHSLNVLELVNQYNDIFKLEIPREPGQKPLKLQNRNFVIACLLHDLCKMNAYLGEEGSYYNNPDKPKGHAKLSIKMASAFIKLEPIEEMMIRYHMGVYGLKEFNKKGDSSNGEYPLRSRKVNRDTKEEEQKARYGKSLRNAWYHNPIVKLMCMCDEMATMQEKANPKTSK